MEDQEYLLVKALKEKPILLEAVYVGEVEDRDGLTDKKMPPIKQDRWVVTLIYQGRKYTTDFYTGIGHRVIPNNATLPPYLYKYRGKKYPQFIGRITIDMKRVLDAAKPVKPEVASVLYCLLLDAQSGEETFNDFCDNFGYDEDSRKAMDIYLACQKATDGIKRLLGGDYTFFQENNEY